MDYLSEPNVVMVQSTYPQLQQMRFKVEYFKLDNPNGTANYSARIHVSPTVKESGFVNIPSSVRASTVIQKVKRVVTVVAFCTLAYGKKFKYDFLDGFVKGERTASDTVYSMFQKEWTTIMGGTMPDRKIFWHRFRSRKRKPEDLFMPNGAPDRKYKTWNTRVTKEVFGEKHNLKNAQNLHVDPIPNSSAHLSGSMPHTPNNTSSVLLEHPPNTISLSMQSQFPNPDAHPNADEPKDLDDTSKTSTLKKQKDTLFDINSVETRTKDILLRKKAGVFENLCRTLEMVPNEESAMLFTVGNMMQNLLMEMQGPSNRDTTGKFRKLSHHRNVGLQSLDDSFLNRIPKPLKLFLLSLCLTKGDSECLLKEEMQESDVRKLKRKIHYSTIAALTLETARYCNAKQKSVIPIMIDIDQQQNLDLSMMDSESKEKGKRKVLASVSYAPSAKRQTINDDTNGPDLHNTEHDSLQPV